MFNSNQQLKSYVRLKAKQIRQKILYQVQNFQLVQQKFIQLAQFQVDQYTEVLKKEYFNKQKTTILYHFVLSLLPQQVNTQSFDQFILAFHNWLADQPIPKFPIQQLQFQILFYSKISQQQTNQKHRQQPHKIEQQKNIKQNKLAQQKKISSTKQEYKKINQKPIQKSQQIQKQSFDGRNQNRSIEKRQQIEKQKNKQIQIKQKLIPFVKKDQRKQIKRQSQMVRQNKYEIKTKIISKIVIKSPQVKPRLQRKPPAYIQQPPKIILNSNQVGQTIQNTNLANKSSQKIDVQLNKPSSEQHAQKQQQLNKINVQTIQNSLPGPLHFPRNKLQYNIPISRYKLKKQQQIKNILNIISECYQNIEMRHQNYQKLQNELQKLKIMEDVQERSEKFKLLIR